jgi:hypothetical protein
MDLIIRHTSLVHLCIVALSLGCELDPQEAKENPGVSRAKEQPSIMQADRVKLLEPPERKGKNPCYNIHASLSARNTLGFGGWPKDFVFVKPEDGFDVSSDTIRQFRLGDGRHAVALYDQLRFYSLVFIYTPPSEAGKQLKVATKNDSLEAWLLRHEGHEYADHYLPLIDWKNFLGASAKDRKGQAKAFKLDGNATVQENQFGLIDRIRALDLRSLKPLPPFLGYLDYKEKEAKQAIEDSEKKINPSSDALEGWSLSLANCQYDREHSAEEAASITGSINSTWAPRQPKWHIVWP